MNPDDLAPEDVVPAMRRLVANFALGESGSVVDPDDVVITASWPAGNDEAREQRALLLEQLEGLCGGFEHNRALIIAASLFDAIRQQMCREGGPCFLHDPERLRSLAVDALDDEAWRSMMDEARAIQSAASS